MVVAKFSKSKRIKKVVKRWKFFKLIGELIGVCLETYIEILITGFMSARSNLWVKAGDILGNILESKSIKYVCRSLYDGI
jgi:hypothetical protein